MWPAAEVQVVGASGPIEPGNVIRGHTEVRWKETE
jgi:hypothetical protein